MPHEFTLPDVGEGIEEAEVVNWLVAEGDAVEEDEPICEIETDKAIVELPSPVDGVVAELHADVGDRVRVGDVLVTVDVEGDVDTSDTTGKSDEDVGGEGAGDEGSRADGAASTQAFASPSTRRAAREMGVDLDDVEGTGPGGRVTEEDVREVAEDGDGTTAAGGPSLHDGGDADGTVLAAPATRGRAREEGVALEEVPTERTRDGQPYVAPEDLEAYIGGDHASAGGSPAAATPEPGDRIPYRGVRREVGERMQRSAQTVPHVTHQDSFAVPRLAETKQALADDLPDDVPLTYTPFVVKAVAGALAEHPRLNAELDEEADEILLHDAVNVGVAVDTPDGLIVPVVDDVPGKSVGALAGEIADLAARARDRSLAPEELRGGTFTVTNIGALGGEYATPLVNHPQVAILAVGRIQERPWVEDGDVVARPVAPLSLAIDHRVVDGADAARFTNAVAKRLRRPERLLLD